MIEFAYPHAFWLMLILPVLWFVWSRRSRRSTIRFSDLDAAIEHRPLINFRLLLPILRTLAIAALIVALARPQKADVSKQTYAEGIAIQMVLDVSSSMSTQDMLNNGGRPQTRISVVKDVFERFVSGDGKDLLGRTNDLIGLIRFARYADSVCPLTLDRKHLERIVDNTTTVTSRNEDGTAIGDGLALAVERLKDLKRTSGTGKQLTIKSKVVILLTDGQNNQGIITPEKAGDLAATYDIKVYTIMAGRGQQTFFGNFIPTDDSELKYIAKVTGGKHYLAQSPDALEKIYEDIDQLERTKTEEKHFVARDERSLPWLLAALALLGTQAFLGATLLRKIP